MYARVTLGTLKPDKVDEFVKMTKEKMLPNNKKRKGFKGLLSMGDRKTGKGILITLWDTEANLMAMESSLPQEALAGTGKLLVGTAATEHYEVMVKA